MTDPSQHSLSDAEKWRRRYEVEAQQRRKEYAIAQDTIQQLRVEVQQLCQFQPSSGKSLPQTGAASLHTKVTELEAECERLAQALAQEQAAHAKTRDNLIGALSDAMGSDRAVNSSVTLLPEAKP